MDPDLAERARATFRKWGGNAPTGAGGLTRKELRLLERKGLVKSALKRLDSGTMIRVWTWMGPK